MAENAVSYNRFTTLPANVSEYGASVEELKLLRGAPDKNPAISPMAAPQASRRALALSNLGSDDLRLTQPNQPGPDPYEGPAPTLVLSRTSAKKLSLGLLEELSGVVDQLEEGETKKAMKDSFVRVAAMRDLLGERNEMAEGIYVRSLAATRG